MDAMETEYATAEPTRAEVDAIEEPLVLEFGTGWCGWCRGAQPLIREALDGNPGVKHVKVEDGPGRPLGRSFGIKLWPTLVFLKQGREVARVTRPSSARQVTDALRKLRNA
jgi:thioredoxin 1